MRVCMVAYAFYETDNRIRRYAETLVKRGDDVDAIVLRREGQSPFELINGVRVYRVQKRVRNEGGPFSYLRKLITFFIWSAIILTIRHFKDRYHLIHVHSVPDFEVFVTIVARLTGAKVVLDIHDIVPELYASKFNIGHRSLVFRLLLLMEKLSLGYPNHVIVSNHLWRAKLTRRSSCRHKCTTIMNFPDPSVFFPRRRPLAPTDEFIVCYPGTLNWHQGVDVAIEAVAVLRSRLPNLKLWIIGDGPARNQLEEMIRVHRLEDRVVMRDPVPLEQVADIMARVDLGIVPKRKNSFGNEAFSTKIMEFMAMGVPVIASNTRVDRFYFNDQLVQFFESESAKDLAAKVMDLACDLGKRNALRESALRFVEQNSWHFGKNDYLSLVDSLVKRRPQTRLTSIKSSPVEHTAATHRNVVWPVLKVK